MDWFLAVLLILSGALSVVCWVVLWRSREHIVAKGLWTLIAAAPVVGPVLFAALHDPPPAQPEIDRALGGPDVIPDMSRNDTPADHP